MIDLLKKSIFDHDIFCSDIKPGNYVVKKSQNDIIVKNKFENGGTNMECIHYTKQQLVLRFSQQMQKQFK